MLPAESLSSIAFVSSWAHSLVQLLISFEDIQDSVDLLVENRQDAIPGSIRFELEQSLPHSKSLEDLLSNTNSLQKKLSQNHFKTITSQLLENTNLILQADRLISLQGKAAGSWLEAVPTSPKFALKPANFRLAARLRLGCSMPMSSAIERCECSKTNDREGYHRLTCKTGGGPIWSHKSVANVWCNSLRDLNITHRREPSNLYEGSNSRPDIIAFDAKSGYDIELDISLAHPWNEDIILQASKVEGAAAAKRESPKTEKYSKEIDAMGNASNCIPLVFLALRPLGIKSSPISTSSVPIICR